MTGSKLRIGIAGLGRMGKRHATNFQDRTQRATVVAVTTPDVIEREWAKENLDGIRVYADYDDMLEKEDLQAVVVSSATSVHAEQALKAIAKGYHVLCEKPLSLDLSVARSVLQAYENSRQEFPDQKVMCAFSRRFDASYREAHELISSGRHGLPVVFRSQTADLHDSTGSFVKYAKTSGGIFMDCSIHDIDLMNWFLGEDRKLKSIQAVGVTAVHPELNAMNDRDNALATVEFEGGRIASLFCSRMMAAGQEDTTEIICERASFRVNMEGRKDHVEIHDTHGARRELPKHYYDRFRDAFITEAHEFTTCCLDNLPMAVSLESSVRAIEIADALQRSLVTGKKIVFDEDGREETRIVSKL
ncbi:oxidoreductase-like protein 23 [Elsinoe australis]|uniref:Oxidoreductase-like protein 23 n=1 Tax=Elsinoe australis TaxID=40998 RepID=A0A4U7AX64_9PEZI|nr:oxidoreductase-like protein 23 [Elsinoe australis]